MPSKVYQFRKRYYGNCSDHVCNCCDTKLYDDHTTTINRDNMVLTLVRNRDEDLCIPPSPCCIFCWLPAVFPCLCCICQRMCCRVRVKKESTNMLFLKNVNRMETLQEDACCSWCPCCCDQDDIENNIYFPHTYQTAYFKNRKEVTEAEALLTSYASRPKPGDAIYQVVQTVQIPVFPVSQLQ